VTIPRGQLKNLKASYTLTDPQLTAPLKKGQVVGTIDFQLNGKSIEQRPLIVMEAVEEGGFFSRMWDFVMMKFHGWFGSWFSFLPGGAALTRPTPGAPTAPLNTSTSPAAPSRGPQSRHPGGNR
jgi:hypothetical protein